MSDVTETNFQAPPAPSMPPVGPPVRRPSHYRPFAIGLFVLGIIGVVLGVLRVMSFTTGAALCFFGLLLFGLSFIPLPVVQEADAPMSLPEKLAGIFYEPSRVFRNLRAHPHWVAPFVIVVVLTGIYSFAFVRRITPERIVSHMIDKMAEMPAPFTPPPAVLEEQRNAQMTALKSPAERIGTFAKSFVGSFFLSCLVSGITLLAVLAFGGRINFWQAVAVSFWAALPIVVIQKGLSLILLYLKAPEDLHPVLNQETLVTDNLGILFSPADHPILFVMTSFIGLTSFYGVWLKAKGLQNGGTKVSSTAAWSVSIVLWVLLLVLVTGITAIFPGFIG